MTTIAEAARCDIGRGERQQTDLRPIALALRPALPKATHVTAHLGYIVLNINRAARTAHGLNHPCTGLVRCYDITGLMDPMYVDLDLATRRVVHNGAWE